MLELTQCPRITIEQLKSILAIGDQVAHTA